MHLDDLLKIVEERRASDLHLVTGEPPVLRIDGELETLDFPPIRGEELKQLFLSALSSQQMERLERELELDVAYERDGGGRYRVNLHYQRSRLAAAIRYIPRDIPPPEKADFTETLYLLTHFHQGLVLVTGPSGCGKSTTLAIMLNIVNQERRAHIITLEDPVEFVYERKQSIVEQREIGADTRSFPVALKYALRQDPNVILVGEMRDLETMKAVVMAAETGHLVFSTLHTDTAAETVQRIVDYFPGHQQKQITMQLASTLRAIITQQLLPRKDGGRVVAREILLNTPAVANCIRTGRLSQIPSIMQTSGKEGMVTMDTAINRLLLAGVIDETTAKNRRTGKDVLATLY